MCAPVVGHFSSRHPLSARARGQGRVSVAAKLVVPADNRSGVRW
jgi:hypothetical protein